MNYIVIVINYNNWQDTVECIQSLNDVGVNSGNILLIENCSTNNSFQMLKINLPKIKIITTDKNLGFTGGNNLGIKYAIEKNFEYAILLNNDTIVKDSNSITQLIKNMNENQDISLGTGRIFYYPQKDIIWYDGGKLVHWRGLAIHCNYGKDAKNLSLNNQAKEVSFISGCYMCIRLKDLPKLGLLNENFFLYLDDIEYSARAFKQNLKLKYFPDSFIYHKANGENNRSSIMVYYSIRNRRLLIKLHYGIMAKIYFEIVLVIKRAFWLITGNKYYHILVTAIHDYNTKKFGQAPENIK